MTIEELLDCMFPGDDTRGIPGFSALGIDSGEVCNRDTASAILALLARVPSDLREEGVDGILRFLRQAEAQNAQDLVNAAIEVYFTAPAVISAITQGPATLFPHARALPDIDYELLEPVFERDPPRGSS